MPGPSQPRRILIVRPSALGDVCRTVPVLASLHAAYPDAEIDWVVRDVLAAPIAAHPALREAIPFPRSRFSRWWRSPAVARELLGWLLSLRRRRYDLVIDCQGLGRSGLITWATGAPRRVGFRSARELAWLGYNVRHRVPAGLHTVDAMLALIEKEGIAPVVDMRLHVADEDRRWWAGRRPEVGAAGPYAVIAPTARWPSKRWPVERWRAVAEALPARGYEAVCIIGAPEEAGQVSELRDAAGAGGPLVDLVGAVSLGQVLAIIERAGIVIAHDSAPLHMAVGLDRPCVALFGPTDPAIVGPYRREEDVIRAHAPEQGGTPNYRASTLDDRYMRLITVEEVLRRVDAPTSASPADAAALRETTP